jgi:hypothetical protein
MAEQRRHPARDRQPAIGELLAVLVVEREGVSISPSLLAVTSAGSMT